MGAGAGGVDRRRDRRHQLLRRLGDRALLPRAGRGAAAGGAGLGRAGARGAAGVGARRAAALRPRLGLSGLARRRGGGDRPLRASACVSLGWLLVSVVPALWLRLGIYAMAALDTWLVASDLLQGPNSVLSVARPAADLPRLQAVHFGSAAMGFGDLFVAGPRRLPPRPPPMGRTVGPGSASRPIGSGWRRGWWPSWRSCSTCSSSRSTSCRRRCRSPLRWRIVQRCQSVCPTTRRGLQRRRRSAVGVPLLQAAAAGRSGCRPHTSRARSRSRSGGGRRWRRRCRRRRRSAGPCGPVPRFAAARAARGACRRCRRGCPCRRSRCSCRPRPRSPSTGPARLGRRPAAARRRPSRPGPGGCARSGRRRTGRPAPP